jgi:hypothetical protein
MRLTTGTTGIGYFPVCTKHTAKARHTAKFSPSVTDGEPPTAALGTAKV